MFRHLINAVGLTALLLALTACPYTMSDTDRPALSPSNIQRTEERALSGFDRVEFNAFGTLLISQGPSEALAIRSADNLLPLIKTTVNGGVLTIEVPGAVRFNGFPQATFTLTVRDLSAITMMGIGAIQVQALNSPALLLRQDGAGSVSVAALNSENLTIEHAGTGDIVVAGAATRQQVTLRGAGNYLGADLRSTDSSIVVTGLGSATVWATGTLTSDLSGVGRVSYWGSPSVTQNATGLGAVVSLGNK